MIRDVRLSSRTISHAVVSFSEITFKRQKFNRNFWKKSKIPKSRFLKKAPFFLFLSFFFFFFLWWNSQWFTRLSVRFRKNRCPPRLSALSHCGSTRHLLLNITIGVAHLHSAPLGIPQLLFVTLSSVQDGPYPHLNQLGPFLCVCFWDRLPLWQPSPSPPPSKGRAPIGCLRT